MGVMGDGGVRLVGTNRKDPVELAARRPQVEYLKCLSAEELGAYADALIAHHLLDAPHPPVGMRFLPRPARTAAKRKATG